MFAMIVQFPFIIRCSCTYFTIFVLFDKILHITFSAFFVATQFFFTLCFVGMLLAIAMVLMYLLCIDDYYRVKVLRWTGVDLIVSGQSEEDVPVNKHVRWQDWQ